MPGRMAPASTCLRRKRAVVTRTEAHAQAVAFLRHAPETPPGSQTAHFGLCQCAQGEQGACQCLLRQSPEEKRLVFVRVDALRHVVSSAFGANAHIVSRGDEGDAFAVSQTAEQGPFQQVVAHGAGDGRAARHVFMDEVVHHGVAECLACVMDEMADAQAVGPRGARRRCGERSSSLPWKRKVTPVTS